MSLSEIALAAASVAVGVGAGSVIVYFSMKRRATNQLQETKPQASEVSSAEILPASEDRKENIVPKEQLEKGKRELRTLLLEKELVSAALTRLYEAEIAREITREERELLGAKYKTELGSLDDRISKLDALIQIGDLETLRDQLVRLVNQKMDSIDRRIESTRLLAGPLIAELTRQSELQKPKVATEEKPKVPDISDMLKEPAASPEPLPQLEKPIVQIEDASTVPLQFPEVKRRTSVDSKAEELQKELLDALDRLAKLDVES
ncbi:MAG: hypothetical protein M1587_00050 [Thaumarchaeota archaeon]|nr:hypothetical protein [Nitrososphaerota archaeon]